MNKRVPNISFSACTGPGTFCIMVIGKAFLDPNMPNIELVRAIYTYTWTHYYYYVQYVKDCLQWYGHCCQSSCLTDLKTYLKFQFQLIFF